MTFLAELFYRSEIKFDPINQRLRYKASQDVQNGKTYWIIRLSGVSDFDPLIIRNKVPIALLASGKHDVTNLSIDKRRRDTFWANFIFGLLFLSEYRLICPPILNFYRSAICIKFIFIKPYTATRKTLIDGYPTCTRLLLQRVTTKWTFHSLQLLLMGQRM